MNYFYIYLLVFNVSVTILRVEEAGVPGENHREATSTYQPPNVITSGCTAHGVAQRIINRIPFTMLKVEKWDLTKDGELTESNMIKKLKSQGYKPIRWEFGPGTVFPDHTHGVSKKDSILTGQFKFSMYGETIDLQPGDMIEVPKETVHNAAVIGSEKVVFFDATK